VTTRHDACRRRQPDPVRPQAEAWTNLAFIAFKRGDCLAAANLGDAATATATRPTDANDMRAFSGTKKELARDPAACRRQAATFHPYPGL
jgi:hypothetical protein